MTGPRPRARARSYWLNDTVQTTRACPADVPRFGGTLVTVIGRNFYDLPTLTCIFLPTEFSSNLHRDEVTERRRREAAAAAAAAAADPNATQAPTAAPRQVRSS